MNIEVLVLYIQAPAICFPESSTHYLQLNVGSSTFFDMKTENRGTAVCLAYTRYTIIQQDAVCGDGRQNNSYGGGLVGLQCYLVKYGIYIAV